MDTNLNENSILEQALLYQLVNENKLTAESVIQLTPKHFVEPLHGDLFYSIMKLFDQGIKLDVASVLHIYRTYRVDASIAEVDSARKVITQPGTANFDVSHFEILKDAYSRRMLFHETEILIDEINDYSKNIMKSMDRHDKKMYEIRESMMRGKIIDKTIKQLLGSFIDAYQNHQTNINTVFTGFKSLDNVLNGFEPGEMIVIGGRPAMGKSSLMGSMMLNMAIDQRVPILYISLEMDETQLALRWICSRYKIPNELIKKSEINFENETIKKELEEINNAPIHVLKIDDFKISDLLFKFRQYKQNNNIRVVFLDYLQLLSMDTGSRYINRDYQISNWINELKRIGKELGLIFVIASQLSRATEKRGVGGTPILSDLRESGSIEQAADKILMLFRPEYYCITEFEDGTTTHEAATIGIVKNRNGATAEIRLTFKHDFARFENYSPPEEYEFKKLMIVDDEFTPPPF